MTISQYIEQVQKLYKTGLSSEHSYRGDLRTLLESIVPEVMVTNEPKRIACGAPDYIITRKEIPVGYIEAKDLGRDIGHKDYKEQFDRYKKSLNNLIITDYIEFWLFVDGELKTKLKIAEIFDHQIKPLPENFEQFNTLIKSFCTHVGQTIRSASKLSVMMADKAKLLAEVIERALNSDVKNEENSSLNEQMGAFKHILIHDITPKEFADIYAQTIAYGMFAARLHDTTLNTFTRQEAAELIPKTNPFLRKLFQYVAGYDLDSRIVWIVDALADIFRATDVAALLQNFGRSTQMNDPIIHFYETFLAEYDPALRKARGVWYTPEPVVNFIVRAVDDILKTEFNLPDGLANNSKIKIKQKAVTKATTDLRSKLKEVETEVEVHKVQILDPATGTGTFLAEVIKLIYNKYKAQQGIWSSYVENHLIPRLNGFELLMASYAMAHLKMDLLLKDTGYKATREQRFRIYLTNSLEEHHVDTGTLFASWLSSEANEANHIKRDTPVMVVMGNPPYSVSSNNKSIDGEGKKTWIGKLIDDYKKDLNERKINLDDDYIKFVRFGQHFIDKNGEGVLAYISNNSFLDGVTHRQMRKSLLECFDKIYVLDLHGNSRIKEVCPDGSVDQNVFDIMQGVSINIFIRTRKKDKNQSFKVHHFNLWGKRDFKYNFLLNNSLTQIPFNILDIKDPYFFFVPKDFKPKETYDNGFQLNNLFINNNTGIQTKCDELSIHFEKEDLEKVVYNFQNLSINELKIKYSNKSDTSGWSFKNATEDLKNNAITYAKILYRPFDIRHTLYTGKSSGFIGRPRTSTMSHMVNEKNLGLITLRINGEGVEFVSLISKFIIEKGSLPRGNYSIFPLYVYPNNSQPELYNNARVPNLNNEIVQQIAVGLNLTFVNEKEVAGEVCFAPIDLLDYIYAVLHSPAYREKYKEFLKIDFPRVPYPTNTNSFWQLVRLGCKLRQLHLLESSNIDNYITTYPQDGENIVITPRYEAGRVYISPTQYFDGVPESTWQFFIGGYQPAQKWLKDRKGRELNFDDILHYQRIIVALSETERLMSEIDEIDFE